MLRNGVRYKLNVVTQDGTEAEDFIHVIVVDSDSNEVRMTGFYLTFSIPKYLVLTLKFYIY